MNIETNIFIVAGIFTAFIVIALSLFYISFVFVTRACEHVAQAHPDYFAKLGSPKMSFLQLFMRGIALESEKRAFQSYWSTWLLYNFPKDYPTTDFECQDIVRSGKKQAVLFRSLFALLVVCWVLVGYIVFYPLVSSGL